MKNTNRMMVLVLSCLASTMATFSRAQDWPQWRGPNRDAKAPEFKAPKTWPKELTQKWKIPVGDGVSTPALVGDKLYVFAREEGNEVTRCLDAATGKELWQEKYESLGASGPASGFSGPRSSPAVANGKVVTLGVRGMLSCLDAATGKKLWRKDDFAGAYPRFHPSSSPLILESLCIVQVGGPGNGGIVAYDLNTGDQKWKWTDDGPAYASPVLMSIGASKLIAAETDRKIVVINAADGKLVWETPFAVQGMGGYNAATPIVDGQTLIYEGSGRGAKAVKIEKEGDGFVAKELWSNTEKSVQFNTPVLKNGFLYGLTSGNEFFCLNAQTGQTGWSAPAGQPPGGGGPGGPGGGPPGVAGAAPGGGPPGGVPPGGGPAGGSPPGGGPPGGGPPGGGPGGGGPGGGRGGRGGRGGGGRGGGYGSIVDAGSVLLALTPSSQLVVFEPNDKEFKQVASYKVADSQTHAYPVVSGNRVFIKDKESLTLWTVE